ncbi:MarC family protein [Brumimicrobium mesophilum]|uniref:MarC family protein n=1 Tax=Brumimicrobium mesophilum TaxID=392717 RepID=UPI000D141FC8|nr:MarC family protein [Brumimicrobium mesophilum]
MNEFFSSINLNEIFKATMVLFAVIDIVGSIPIIIKIKETSGDIHANRITLVSLVIMIAFLITGESILMLFGVNVESFAVAGAFVLFAMALEMIMGIELFKETPIKGKSVGIVPLAFPIIAGAGSMTTLISLRAEYEMINILIAILINMLIVFATLKLTRRIERILGPGGVAILKKVFGIILLAIAVKLFASNVTQLFQ